MKGQKVWLGLVMLSMFLLLSMSVIAQAEQEIKTKISTALGKITEIVTYVFWPFLLLEIIFFGAMMAAKGDDPTFRERFKSKMIWVFVGTGLIALASTIVAFLQGVWG